MKRFLPSAALVVTTIMLTLLLQPYLQAFASQSAAPQAQNCRTFTETGKQLCGKFLDYWNAHGALAQQGFPISNEFQETSATNGQVYTVQYFERAVFELHPENQAPNDVLLSLLGSFQYKAKYPNGEPGAPPPTAVPAAVPPGPGGIITLRDGVTIQFATDSGLFNTQCNGTPAMKWIFTFKNNSAVDYIINSSNFSQTDSNGNQYGPWPQPSNCHGTGAQEALSATTILPKNGGTARGVYNADGALPTNLSYIEFHMTISGTPITFRYPLR